MNGDRPPPGADVGRGTDDLDDLDAVILAQLRDVHQRLDPPPAALDELVLFSLGALDPDTELARLVDDELAVTARTSARTRSVTLEADSVTILLSIVDSGADAVRVDGWLAPPGRSDITVRRPGGRSSSTTSDADGRFVLTGMPRGDAQLVVSRSGVSVVTPVIHW